MFRQGQGCNFKRALDGGCVTFARLRMDKPSSPASQSREESSTAADPKASSPEVEGPADDELVALCQQGDTGAYDVLVTRYRGRVYGMIYNMVKSEADAWDLAQEAFIKA